MSIHKLVFLYRTQSLCQFKAYVCKKVRFSLLVGSFVHLSTVHVPCYTCTYSHPPQGTSVVHPYPLFMTLRCCYSALQFFSRLLLSTGFNSTDYLSLIKFAFARQTGLGPRIWSGLKGNTSFHSSKGWCPSGMAELIPILVKSHKTDLIAST